MTIDPVDPLEEIQKAYEETVAAQEKAAHDHQVYLQKIASISKEKGFDLGIALLYAIMANYPSQQDPDATMSGFYENKIAITGDSMMVMGQLTSFTNGMEDQFSNKSGTTDDLRAFAHSADEFLDATDPKTGWMTKGNVIPPATIEAARAKILAMRQDIKIVNGDQRYNPTDSYALTDDPNDKTGASHSFSELYTNAQNADDKGIKARDAVKLFTQGFDGVSSIFDGANSSLKLQVDQDTNDSKNMTSAMVTFGQGFFKPSDTAIANSRPQ